MILKCRLLQVKAYLNGGMLHEEFFNIRICKFESKTLADSLIRQVWV